MRRGMIAAACLLWLPLHAWAADGDAVAGSQQCIGEYCQRSYYLCDSKVAADDPATCANFDLWATGHGIPHHYVVSVEETDGCSGSHNLLAQARTTASGTTAHELSADVDTFLVVTNPNFRYIQGYATTLTGCNTTGANDGYDAYITLFFER